MPSAATIGSLRVQLGLDTANFDAGIKRAQSNVRGLDFGKGLKAGLGEVQAGFRDTASRAGVLGTALSGMGLAGVAAGAALVGVAAAVGHARTAFAFADDIADTANKLAISTKGLQEYRFAVHALGGDYTDADKALEGFAKSFGAAHAGLTKRAAKPFEALGLDAKSFNTTEEAFDAVIDKISKLSSTAEQAAIADKLGLSPMLPALRAGTAAIDEMRAAANRLGYVMDDALIQKGGEANDKMEDLEKILSVQLNGAFIELAPVILSVSGAIASAAVQAGRLIGKLNELNTWAASNDLLAMFRWAGQAGAATGKFLGTDQVGKKLGLGPDQVSNVTTKGIAAAIASYSQGTPSAKNGSLIAPGAGSSKSTKGGSSGPSAQQRAEASADAIEAATRAELDARQALTHDIETLATLRSQEVDDQLKASNRRLQEDAAAGRITAAAASTAASLNERAAEARKSVIRQEADADLDAQMLQSREKIYGFYDQIAKLQADGAKTAGARNEIEAKALAYRQKLDREQLASELDQKVARGEILDSLRVATLAAQADAQAAERSAADREARERAERELQDAYYDAAYAVDSVAAAFANRDWNGVLNGLMKAIENVQKAFSEGGSIGGKIGAIAGVVGSVGNMIGGTAGSALSGAASGAMAGFTLGGPVGAAIGGVLGGISSLFGSSKAKKKAKAEAAERARQEEAARVQAVANQKRELEIALMEAQGKSAEALAASRADELAAMDASNRGLQEQIYALEDAAKAAAEAVTKRGLEADLMDAQGDALGALAIRRELELAAMDESLRGLQEAINAAEDFAKASSAAAGAVEDARADLAAAYQRQASDLRGVIDKFKAFSTSLRAFRDSLAASSPKGRYDATKAAFEATRAKALAGDEEAIGKLQAVSEAYLDASKEFYASSPQFFADLASVKDAVSATADLTDGMASSAEQQLAALDRLVEGQIETRDATLTVAEALERLAQSLGSFTSITGQKLGANPSANAALAAATGYKGDFGSGGWDAWIRQQDAAMKATAKAILDAFGQSQRTGFALSSAAEIDAQLASMAAVSAQAPGTAPNQANDNTAIVDALAALDQGLGKVVDELAADKLQRAAISTVEVGKLDQVVTQTAAVKRAYRSTQAA